MADTTFVPGTPVLSSWLNDVNDHVYGASDIGTSIFQYMTAAQIADVRAGTLTMDVTAAFTAALADGVAHIYCPAGKYKLSPMVWTGLRGFVLQGTSSTAYSAGVSYLNNTTFFFDSAAAGTNGLTITDFVGVRIQDINISMRRGGAGGGIALYMYNGHDYTIDRVCVDLFVGSSGSGIKLGGGNAVTATFAGDIRNCKVLGYTGKSFDANWGTSLTFTSCYNIGGTYSIYGMIYTSLVSCASDSAGGRWGYEVTNCLGLSFISCGAEAADKGAWMLEDVSNTSFISCVGSANNALGLTTIGDFIHITNNTSNSTAITIDNPASINPNAATTSNIYGSSGTGYVTVNGVTNTNLSKGIAGDATWKTTKLTFNGDGEMVSWTPTLVGWTNVGTPTVTGKYVKQGKIVTFYVNVTPATSISSTVVTSTITGLPFTPMAGSGTQTDGNARSLGAVAVSAAGTIYPQTTGVLTTTTTIIGTLILN